jgi:hypothetical protein
MIVILESTYNGKEGLFIGGQPIEMTKTKLAMIQEDCDSRKVTINHRVVKEGDPINRPAKKQQGTPQNKQQTNEKTK